jgi:hypothetical protein
MMAAGAITLTQGLVAGEHQPPAAGGRKSSELVVYVSSQGLYYDSIISARAIPPNGPFQKLEGGGPHGGPMTEWGPGDHDNGDGEMDEEDAYFVCPLLGPGRAES